MKNGYMIGLVLLVVFCCTPGYAQIQWAGAHLIDLDATRDLTVGEPISSWPNPGTAGGAFNTPSGTLQVAAGTPGVSGTPINAVVFDGANYLQFTLGLPAEMVGQSFSLEIWYENPNMSSNREYLWGVNKAFVAPYTYLVSETTRILSSGAVIQFIDWQTSPPNPLMWIYQALTYDAATGEFAVYANGLQDQVHTGLLGWDFGPAGSLMTLGAMEADAGGLVNYPLTGSISEFRIHGGALTPAQVMANFDEEKADFVAPFISHSGSVGFGNVSPGGPYGPQTITYKNDGAMEMTFAGPGEGVEITGPNASEFSMDPDPADTSPLAVGAQRTVDIYCSPADSQPKIAFLTVTSNASNSPVQISLSANYSTVYVNGTTGTDDFAIGRGLSAGDPFETISFALSVSPFNVYVDSGTYPKFDISGEVDLTISALTPGGVTVALGAADTMDINTTIGTLNLVVDGFNFNKTAGTQAVITIGAGAGTKNVTFNRCDITTSGGGSGISNGGPNLNLTVDNSVLHDCGASVITSVGRNDCTFNLYRSQFLRNGGRLEIQGVIGGNVVLDMDRCIVSSDYQSLIVFRGTSLAGTVTNTIWECGDGNTYHGKDICIDLYEIATPNLIAFDNCTVIRTGSQGGVGIEPRGGKVRNCIVLGFNTDIGAGAQLTTNLITSDSTNNLFVGQSGAWVRPADVGITDYHIQGGSAAVGTGTNVGLSVDLDGMLWKDPPSKGAYEFGSVPEATPTPIGPTPTPLPPTTGVEDWSAAE
jgi:hypothetical protein